MKQAGDTYSSYWSFSILSSSSVHVALNLDDERLLFVVFKIFLFLELRDRQSELHSCVVSYVSITNRQKCAINSATNNTTKPATEQ